MGNGRLRLMDPLQLLEAVLGTGQPEFCRELHQTEVGVDVGSLFVSCEGMPCSPLQFGGASAIWSSGCWGKGGGIGDT